MKRRYFMALVLVLTAVLFAGCRNTTDPTATTTKRPATSAATQSTVIPSPNITLPLDTTGPESTSTGTMPATTNPAARGPRY